MHVVDRVGPPADRGRRHRHDRGRVRWFASFWCGSCCRCSGRPRFATRAWRRSIGRPKSRGTSRSMKINCSATPCWPTVRWWRFGPTTASGSPQQEFLRGTPPTAAAFDPQGVRAAFGFADGTVRLANIHFTTTFVEPADLPERLARLAARRRGRVERGGVDARGGGSIPAATFGGRTRSADCHWRLGDAIERIDYSARPSGEMFCVLSAEGRLELHAAHRRENLLTGETIVETTGSELPWNPPDGQGLARLFAPFRSGRSCFRGLAGWHAAGLRHPRRRPSQTRRSNRPGSRSRRAAHGTAILARQRDAAGRRFARPSAGLVRRPRRRKRDRRTGATGDGPHVCRSGPGSGQPTAEVRCLASSGNSRLFAVGYSDRAVRLYYPTNERLVLDTQAPADAAPQQLTLAPRDNGLLGFAGQELVHWTDRPRLSGSQLAGAVLAGLVRRNAPARRWSGSRARVRPAPSRS